MKSKLPNKASELIRLALDDLKKVERKPGAYTIDMGHYHAVMDGACHVCFAGSVMAMSLEAASSERVSPENFDVKTRDRLYALDHFRRGDIESGLCAMGLKKPKWFANTVKVVQYEHNPTQFKRDMRAVANKLEELGL